MNKLLSYVLLPPGVSASERAHLQRTNRVALLFFWAHVPAFALIAYVNDTGAFAAALLTSAIVLGPTVLARTAPPRLLAPIFGFVAMCLGGLLVHFGQGIVQMEMHFYFFVLLALLAVFGNPLAIVVAAATVAAHHALLWLVLPASVFNYDAPFWVVGVHASFVILESVAACYVARSFFDNVIGLEKVIEARTLEIDKKNRDMRSILDAVHQGLVVVKRDGTMSPERSAILERWLGQPAPQDTFFTWLARADADQARWFQLCFETLFEDVLPIEVTLAQMPRDIVLGDRVLELELHMMAEAETAMLTLTDVSAQRASDRAELVQRDATSLFQRLMHDRSSVKDLVDEGTGIVERLVERRAVDTAEARRLAHTLKGNAGLFGLERVVKAAHDLESSIADDGISTDAAHFAVVAAVWEETVAGVRPFLKDDRRVDVSEEDIDGLLSALREGASHADLARQVAGFKQERGHRRLERMTEQAQVLAVRLGKPLGVRIECASDLRLPSNMRAFWATSAHLIRNAVGHGIETTDERHESGKAPAGEITFVLRDEGDDLVFSIADDGRGIDWRKVGEAAHARGLPFATEHDKIEALFADGLSTSASLDDLSGRGIGMDAVRALNGEITLTSTTGAGTLVATRFRGARASTASAAAR